jgi:hypothetical protein
MSCNLDYSVCWTDSIATIFDSDGQPSLSSEIRTYIEGRDEVVIWEGRYSDTCSMTVNGEACNICGYTTCSDDSQAFTSGIIFHTQNFHTPYFSSGKCSFCYEMPDDIFPK